MTSQLTGFASSVGFELGVSDGSQKLGSCLSRPLAMFEMLSVSVFVLGEEENDDEDELLSKNFFINSSFLACSSLSASFWKLLRTQISLASM